MRRVGLLLSLFACERTPDEDRGPPPAPPHETRVVPAGWTWTGCTRVLPGVDDAHRDACVRADPPRSIYSIAFTIDRRRVRVADYARCTEATYCNRLNKPARAHEPALVSWYEAVAYCEWRGAGVPSAADWEKAARGLGAAALDRGVTRPYDESPFGVLELYAPEGEWVRDYDGPIVEYIKPVWREVIEHGRTLYALDLRRTEVKWLVTSRSHPGGPDSSTAHMVKGRSGLAFDRTRGDRDARHAFRCVTGESVASAPWYVYPVGPGPYPHGEDSPQPEPGRPE